MLKSKKILVVGYFGVGKTSLIRKFVHNEFSDNYKVTIGVHISKKEVEVPKQGLVSLIFWDIEGADDMDEIRSSYLLGTHGVVYIFDVSRPKTFTQNNDKINFLKEKLPKAKFQVIGNKVDLVVENELTDTLKKAKIEYDFLTSAKTGKEVEQAFLQMANTLYCDE